jgi:hypothetical protein
MKLNISISSVIAFTKETNFLHYAYIMCDSSRTHNDTIKNLGVQPDSKLHFHTHIDYSFSQSIWMLDLIQNIIYSFPTLESILTLYLTPVRPKFEYASAVKNSMSSNTKKLEHIQ